MKEISEIFGIDIKNTEYFRQALTHPSYTRENNLDYTSSYERLEFLGDAVLKLAVSDIIYKKYPNYAEGNMSKIRSFVVSDATLFEVCKKIGLSELIIMGDHDKKYRNVESVCACALEAVFGAFYLDGKYSELVNFISREFMVYIEDVDKNFEKYNAKALLQVYTQGHTKTTPDYNLVSESGPPHKKIFEVEVVYEGEVVASGQGSTKKEAEQHAAYNACQKLGVIPCQK